VDNTFEWPAHLPVGAVRFARPTAHYDECIAFYGEDLALPIIASWRDHDGYDGVCFGLPGAPVHIELTQHLSTSSTVSIPESSSENQLVLYLSGSEAVTAVIARLTARGHMPARLDNPYWEQRGAVAFADPDGWMVVLAPWVFGVDPVPQPTARPAAAE
jgi:hypothetical protein